MSDRNNRKSIREKLADAIDISKDVILDTVLIKTIGNMEVTIENYKGILEYSNNCILIKAKPKNVRVSGEDLEIGTITEEMLYISGLIYEIAFTNN